jgi:transcriptional regulator with XRE-family HTH domain
VRHQPQTFALHAVPLVPQARAIRELRVVRWLSQEELGFQARLHRNYVGAVERGETNLTFRSLLAFTAGLDVSLAELVAIYERQLRDAG